MFVSACLRGRMSLKGHTAVQLQDGWRQGSNPESLSRGSSFNQTLLPARKTWSLPARGFWQGWKTQIMFTKEPGMIAGSREPRNMLRVEMDTVCGVRIEVAGAVHPAIPQEACGMG